MARGGAGVRDTAPMKFIILFFGSGRGRFGIRRGSCFLLICAAVGRVYHFLSDPGCLPLDR